MRLLILFLISISLCSCQRTWKGEGPVVSDVRQVDDFNRVVLSMNAEVIINDTLVHSCVVHAQSNLQEAIVTRIDGNALVITSKGNIETDRPVVIEISMSQPVGFEVNGSGKMKGKNTVKNEEIDIEVNGSGSFESDLVANKTIVSVSGSGMLNLSGSTNSFDLEINGSGTINAFNFSTHTSRARISGSGEAYLTVGEKLKADVTGSGTIRYKGDPEVTSEVDGSGTVVKQSP